MTVSEVLLAVGLSEPLRAGEGSAIETFRQGFGGPSLPCHRRPSEAVAEPGRERGGACCNACLDSAARWTRDRPDRATPLDDSISTRPEPASNAWSAIRRLVRSARRRRATRGRRARSRRRVMVPAAKIDDLAVRDQTARRGRRRVEAGRGRQRRRSSTCRRGYPTRETRSAPRRSAAGDGPGSSRDVLEAEREIARVREEIERLRRAAEDLRSPRHLRDADLEVSEEAAAARRPRPAARVRAVADAFIAGLTQGLTSVLGFALFVVGFVPMPARVDRRSGVAGHSLLLAPTYRRMRRPGASSEPRS